MDSQSKVDLSANGGDHYKWLHRFALLTAVTTFFLIFVGGLVKSHEAGLSVPDWPTTYGEFMLSFPYSKWVGNIFYEHSHRVLATLVGAFITAEAIWLQLSKVSKQLKWLGWIAFVGVCIQGYLGGLTVKYLLPTSISTGHSMLAQGVCCLTVTIVLFTSKAWPLIKPVSQSSTIDLRKLAAWTVGVVAFQIMLGAIMRHENAGLAISTFPLASGKLIPDFTSSGVALNFAHRLGALVASGFVLTTVTIILRDYRSEPMLTRPGIFAVFVLVTQITLGAITILSAKAVTPTTLHVSGGTLLLCTMLVISLLAHKRLAPKASNVRLLDKRRSATLPSTSS